MGEDVSATIAALDAWLSSHRPAYYAELQPGASPAALDALEAELGLTLPLAFRQLYMWRNGHDDSRSAALQHNRMFLPLDALAEVKLDHDAMIGADFPTPDWWLESWVPFAQSYGGDLLVVTADGSADGGAVIGFWHDDAYRPVRSASLAGWLDALVASMEDGSYEADGKTWPAAD